MLSHAILQPGAFHLPVSLLISYFKTPVALKAHPGEGDSERARPPNNCLLRTGEQTLGCFFNGIRTFTGFTMQEPGAMLEPEWANLQVLPWSTHLEWRLRNSTAVEHRAGHFKMCMLFKHGILLLFPLILLTYGFTVTWTVLENQFASWACERKPKVSVLYLTSSKYWLASMSFLLISKLPRKILL